MSPEEIRREAARLQESTEDVCRRLESVVTAIEIDVDKLSEEELNWHVKPSLELYLLGTLSAALETLREGRDQLSRAAAATPEKIHKEWLALRASRRKARQRGR